MNRREFLQFLQGTALGAASLFVRTFPVGRALEQAIPSGSGKLGRVCAGEEGAQFALKAEPRWDAKDSGKVLRDSVIVWQREVVASQIDINRINQRWVETPDGYIYVPYVQPVKNTPNIPLQTLPKYGEKEGMWVEVTVPYVDLTLLHPAQSPGLKNTLKPRLYYSQVLWVDQINQDDAGKPVYRLSEKFGSYGDVFQADAAAFRPILPDEIAPIHPEVEDKHIQVNLAYQTLSCFEGKNEVYFCRVSTGWGGATPIGTIPIWRKMISTHMSGGTTGAGYDTPGIGWTSLFSKDGAAIHSTFWHNDFGLARSHGCVNAMPEDAKWVFRWTYPSSPYDPGDITISGMNNSTNIVITED